MGRACPQALRHDADVIARPGVAAAGHVDGPWAHLVPKKGNLRQSGNNAGIFQIFFEVRASDPHKLRAV